jgi:hypothetical protein
MSLNPYTLLADKLYEKSNGIQKRPKSHWNRNVGSEPVPLINGKTLQGNMKNDNQR